MKAVYKTTVVKKQVFFLQCFLLVINSNLGPTSHCF